MRKFLWHMWLCVLLSLFGSGCAVRLSEPRAPAAGTYRHRLDERVMGVRRHYRLHIPSRPDPDAASALVLVVHGAFSTPQGMERMSGFSELADREGLLVAYPAGAYGVMGLLRHWNAGHCCGRAARDNLDDVGFLDQVIDDIRRRVAVDDKRIYMVGLSNGGMLVYRYAAERTHRLAGAAVVAAALGGRASSQDDWWITPAPEMALPMMIFHARDDDSVPYAGGVSPRKGGEREYVSVAQSVDFWVRNNECRPEAMVASLYDGRVTRSVWRDDRAGNDVVLYTIENWGHRWPGKHFSNRLAVDDPLHGFDAADKIWNFFQGRTIDLQGD